MSAVVSFHNDGGKTLLSVRHRKFDAHKLVKCVVLCDLMITFIVCMQELDVEDHPGIEEALHSFIGVVREQLEAMCRLKEFKHVIIQETEDPFEVSPSVLIIKIEVIIHCFVSAARGWSISSVPNSRLGPAGC